MEEIWKDIKDYEGIYQVSNLGRIKRLPYRVKNRFGTCCRKEHYIGYRGTRMKLWIARDVCNISLKLFFEKPVEQEGNWVVKHIDKLNRMYYGNSISIDNNLFPEVTFENSPQEVELKLVGK